MLSARTALRSALTASGVKWQSFWNRLMEQTQGTESWNRIMEQTQGTESWNRIMEQTQGTSSWNRLMEQAQSSAEHTSQQKEVGS